MSLNSYQSKRWLRICYSTAMETLCRRNDRRVRAIHTEAAHCLYDNRYFRNWLVSVLHNATATKIHRKSNNSIFLKRKSNASLFTFSGFDFEALRNSIEEDYTEFITISSEMIYIEIITKIFVCFYEALWTRQGHGANIGGATPGKIFMGIRILYVEAVLPLDPAAQQPANLNNLPQTSLRALIYPAQNPGFKRAFGRALAKNLLMALLFPLCFVVLFFRNNRTSYDILTKTIVVEENAQPVLRRP